MNFVSDGTIGGLLIFNDEFIVSFGFNIVILNKAIRPHR
jgi:hypothetical protein